LGPVRFFRRTVTRLNSVGWFRAAGSLSFVTLLGLVPLATVAFAFVAQFPLFQDFLQVLERFLLRHLLPESASTVVHQYVVVLAADAANVVGRSIVFVAVTAALAIDTIESEINEIWGVRKKAPDRAASARLCLRHHRRPCDTRRNHFADRLDTCGSCRSGADAAGADRHGSGGIARRYWSSSD
jgi:uncharacterized BrkB/YihY/UPF0761 family membrane protein